MNTRKMTKRMNTRKIQVDVVGVILAVATALFMGGWLAGLAMTSDHYQARIVCQEEDSVQFQRDGGVLYASCD